MCGRHSSTTTARMATPTAKRWLNRTWTRLYIVPFRRCPPSLGWLFRAPFPTADRRQVVAVLGNVFLVLDQLFVDRLFEVRGLGAKLRQTVDDVFHQMESVKIVHDDHVERR